MQRWVIPLNIALGFLLVAVMALIASDLIGGRLKQMFPVVPPKSTPTLQSEQLNNLLSFSPILEKGLFGPATRGRLTPMTTAAVSGVKTGPAAAPGDFVLLGTATGSFRESFALVQKMSTQEERVFRLGESVFGAGPLLSVRKEQIEILMNGQKVKLMTPLLTGIDSTGGGTFPSQHTPGTPGGLALPQGSGSYVIDQRALNGALDNIGQAMSDARLLPSLREGRVEGLRATEVKPQGIFGTVGIKNGDVLLRVNDFPMDSPERAIQAFVTLKGQNRVKLDLVRDGQPTTFTYDIR